MENTDNAFKSFIYPKTTFTWCFWMFLSFQSSWMCVVLSIYFNYSPSMECCTYQHWPSVSWPSPPVLGSSFWPPQQTQLWTGPCISDPLHQRLHPPTDEESNIMLLFRITTYKSPNRSKITLFNKDTIGWTKNLYLEDALVVGKVCKSAKCNSI